MLQCVSKLWSQFFNHDFLNKMSANIQSTHLNRISHVYVVCRRICHPKKGTNIWKHTVKVFNYIIYFITIITKILKKQKKRRKQPLMNTENTNLAKIGECKYLWIWRIWKLFQTSVWFSVITIQCVSKCYSRFSDDF